MTTIILITNNYPYGKSEKFLEDEIAILAYDFDHVIIYPSYERIGEPRAMPSNCSIWPSALNWRKAEIFSWIGWVAKSYKNKQNFRLGDFKRSWHFFVRSLQGSNSLRSLIKNVKNHTDKFIIYHYWKNETLLWSHQAQISEMSSGSIVARAHRYDLYQDCGYIALRDFIAKIPRKIFPISNHGAEYLKNTLHHESSQISIHRLGVNIPCNTTPVPKGETIEFVTLSFFNKVKRLDLVVKALKLSKIKIKWHLIGSGPESRELKSMLVDLPDNVEVVQYGLLSSAEVHTFFETQALHFLLNVSESEGIPVSMMESLSWGVPIIATAVGGVPEIVTQTTGVLLSANPTAEEIYTCLVNVANGYNGISYRKICKEAATEHWNAKKNHKAFVQELSSLVN